MAQFSFHCGVMVQFAVYGFWVRGSHSCGSEADHDAVHLQFGGSTGTHDRKNVARGFRQQRAGCAP